MFAEIISAAGQIVAPVANVVTKTELVRAVRNFVIDLRLRLTVTLAGGPATAILNGGTPWAAFDRVGLDENGTKRVDLDPRLAILWTAMFTGQDNDAGRVRATNLADGPYALEESIMLPFSGYPIAGPAESVFLERNVNNAFSAFVTKGPDSVANRLVQTPGTAVTSGVTVEVAQRYDWERAKRTMLVPVVRQVELQIPAASTEMVFKIDSTRYLQGIIVQQDTSGAGEVSDIINRFALRADGRDLIGPGLVDYEQLQSLAQQEFAGPVVPRGALPLWFRKGGRLGNILNPNALSNLRAVMNVQPSVTPGAGTSVVRLLLLELEHVEGLTVPPKGFAI
jgi:hypothetical protein